MALERSEPRWTCRRTRHSCLAFRVADAHSPSSSQSNRRNSRCVSTKGYVPAKKGNSQAHKLRRFQNVAKRMSGVSATTGNVKLCSHFIARTGRRATSKKYECLVVGIPNWSFLPSKQGRPGRARRGDILAGNEKRNWRLVPEIGVAGAISHRS